MSLVSRAIRNITRRKARVLLAIIAIGVAMAIMVSIPAGINADQAAVEGMTQRLNVNDAAMAADIENTSTMVQVGNSRSSGIVAGEGFEFNRNNSNYNAGSASLMINQSAQSGIASIDGVSAVVPYVVKTEGMPQPGSFTPGEFSRGQRPNFSSLLGNVYQVEGASLSARDIDNYGVLPSAITSGTNLQPGKSGSVLLTDNLTKFFKTQLNGAIVIENHTFTVAGIYEPSINQSNRTVYMSLEDAQNIFDLGASVSYLDVYADNTTVVNDVASAIQAAYPDLPVSTMSDRLNQLTTEEQNTAQALASANATISQTRNTGLQEIVIAVGAAGMVIMFTMLYAVRERTKEIGVLKALGFSKRTVIAQFMLEGVIVTAIAGLLGIALGWVGSSALFSLLLPSPIGGGGGAFRSTANAVGSLNIQPDPSWILIAFLLVVIIGALGSLYPAWRASRTRPVEALRNE